ncbi:MAG: hypothetical protein RMJ81_07050 [Candidatus Kryptonium sp.]|nr:hypothetical protein [Candidatus Kryptonium sp.]
MKLIFEIFKFFLKIDLRTGKEGKVSYERILLILLINFFWFFMLSFSIAISGTNKQSLTLLLLDFAFIIFTVELVLIIFNILVEFDVILLNSREVEFFSYLPIDSTTYGFAKYLNFLFFVSLLNFSLNLSPAVVLLILNTFIPNVNAESFVKISVAYLIVSSLYVIFVSNLVFLVLFFLGKGIKLKKFKEIILPAQIFAVFIVFLIYQLINKYLISSDGTGSIFITASENLKFLKFLPQFIFSKIFVSLSGVGNVTLQSTEIVGIAIIFFILLIVPSLIFNLENIKNMLASYTYNKRSEKRYLIVRFLERFKDLFFKSELGLATYELVYAYLRKDKSIKVKVLSAFFISIAIAVYFVFFDVVEDPLANPDSRANVMTLLSLFFNVTAGIVAIQSHRDHQASWIYHFVRTEEIYDVFRAGLMVLWHHVLIPLIVIFFFIYLVKIGDLASVSFHFVVTFLVLKIFFNFANLLFANLPLSQPMEKLSSIDKILPQFFALFAVFVVIIFERGAYGLVLKSESYLSALFVLIFLIVVERYSLKVIKQKVVRILNV